MIVPILEDDAAIRTRWARVAEHPDVGEVILVMPRAPSSSRHGSIDRRSGLRSVSAPLGRASQMNAGAGAARGDRLIFVHGDTDLDEDAVGKMARALETGPDSAWAFALGFRSTRRRYRFLEWLAALRDGIRPFPLGDQGLGISRGLFQAMGGFPDLPLFEDVVMVRRLTRVRALRVLETPARTGTARFEERGVVRTLLTNLGLLILFGLRVSPETLVRHYYGAAYLARWRSADPARTASARSSRMRRTFTRTMLMVMLPTLAVTAPAAAAVSATVSAAVTTTRTPTVDMVAEATPPLAHAVDHTHHLLDRTLGRFVSDGLVDYRGLSAAAADPGSAFSRYLVDLAAGSAADETTWSRGERLAYWINAYNAFTLKLIVDHYPIGARWYMTALPFLRIFLPTNSILQIPDRWDGVTFGSVRGSITLGAIEHDILRPEFRDPRVHFAIVCASLGCPKLRDSAYHGDRIDAELDAATTGFLRDPDKVLARPGGREIAISRIFKWFRGDFDVPPPADRPALARVDGRVTERYGEDAGVVRWLLAYGDDPLRNHLAASRVEIEYLSYDWELNEKETGR